jgi:hypothetical protein
MSERKGVEIDYCPDCRGVWLDRGELDKILEQSRAEQPEAPATPRPAQNDYRSNDYRHNERPYKRKKSIFEELFD